MCGTWLEQVVYGLLKQFIHLGDIEKEFYVARPWTHLLPRPLSTVRLPFIVSLSQPRAIADTELKWWNYFDNCPVSVISTFSPHPHSKAILVPQLLYILELCNFGTLFLLFFHQWKSRAWQPVLWGAPILQLWTGSPCKRTQLDHFICKWLMRDWTGRLSSRLCTLCTLGPHLHLAPSGWSLQFSDCWADDMLG